MGSGSTMVACQNTNRKGIGIEQDSKYFKIAQDNKIDSDSSPLSGNLIDLLPPFSGG